MDHNYWDFIYQTFPENRPYSILEIREGLRADFGVEPEFSEVETVFDHLVDKRPNVNIKKIEETMNTESQELTNEKLLELLIDAGMKRKPSIDQVRSALHNFFGEEPTDKNIDEIWELSLENKTMTTEQEETKFEIVPLDLKVVGDATGNVALFHKSVFDYLDHLAVVELKEDADFVQAKDLIKQLQAQEDLIGSAEEAAKNGSVTVADAFRMLDEAKGAVRKARLALNTQVKADTDKRKSTMVTAAVSEITTFRNELIHGLQISEFTWSFEAIHSNQIKAVIHGKSISDKTQKSVNAEVESIKLSVEQSLNLIASNKALVESQENSHLFKDIKNLVLMPFMELKTFIDEQNVGEKERLDLLQKQEQEKAEAKAKKEQEEKQAEEAKKIKNDEAERIKETKLPNIKFKKVTNPDSTVHLTPTSDQPFINNDSKDPNQDQVEYHEQMDKDLPSWMEEADVKENLTTDGIQTFQLTFQATQVDASGIQSYIQKIYMGSNPTLTLANQQG